MMPQPVGYAPPQQLAGSPMQMALGGQPQMPMAQTGLPAIEQALINGGMGAADTLYQSGMMARNDINNARDNSAQARAASHRRLQRGTDAAAGGYAPYLESGAGANSILAALSGSMGNGAQGQAFQDFMSSPEQAFLRQQGEQSVIRNSAALGGLGGGNVMKELTRFGTGLASQDFNNHFNRLSSVSDRGFNAAQGNAQVQMNQGNQAAGLANNNANREQAYGNALGGIASDTGSNIAQVLYGTGQGVAGQRSQTTSALSQLINNQGAGASDIIGQGAAQIAGSQQNLAELLGNLQTGQASQVASLPSAAQLTQPTNFLGQVGQVAGGLSGLLDGLGGSTDTNANLARLAATMGPM